MNTKYILFVSLILAPTIVRAAEIKIENGQFFTTCLFEKRRDNCHLDTGAYTARVRAYPPFSGYPSLGKTKTKGVSGEIIESDLIRLKKISIHELSAGRSAVVSTLPTTFPYSVLGLEFFNELKQVTFDFQAATILKKGPLTQSLCPSTFEIKDNLLKVPVLIGAMARGAAWDTGASLTVVNIETAQKHPEQFKFIRDLGGQDSSGSEVKAKLYRLKTITVCGQTFDDLDIVAVDMSEPKKEMPDFPDVFIGANLMMNHVWSFDFDKETWSFK